MPPAADRTPKALLSSTRDSHLKMNIGLIADIHADYDSLKIALDILEGKAADTILCAGDLVEKGPKGDAVADLIRQRNIPCGQS
jgi:Icc-related predicted phosphoesterase